MQFKDKIWYTENINQYTIPINLINVCGLMVLIDMLLHYSTFIVPRGECDSLTLILFCHLFHSFIFQDFLPSVVRMKAKRNRRT